MRLFLLYGPPASGKLTVARMLSERAGYCLFDNSLSVNLVKSVFRFGSPAFIDVCREVRCLIFSRAIREMITDVVFTMCYSHPRELPFVERVENIVAQGGGRIVYVFITAPLNVLEGRMNCETRSRHRKINTVEELRENLRRNNYIQIPGRPSLSIDSSQITPEQACDAILRYVDLDAERCCSH